MKEKDLMNMAKNRLPLLERFINYPTNEVLYVDEPVAYSKEENSDVKHDFVEYNVYCSETPEHEIPCSLTFVFSKEEVAGKDETALLETLMKQMKNRKIDVKEYYGNSTYGIIIANNLERCVDVIKAYLTLPEKEHYKSERYFENKSKTRKEDEEIER